MPLTVPDPFQGKEVGVIIGRFQVHKLHEAHRELIQIVRDRHPKTIILLGVPATRGSRRNPLDFQMRKQMIQETFPDLDDIYYIKDQPDDREWSKAVDREIRENVREDATVVLYGSRDSFVSHYHGQHQVCELESDRIVSGTELRNVIANQRRGSEDFRAGVIYNAENGYAHPWTTVDTAILNEDKTKVLLGHKRTDPKGKYGIIGGFVRTRLVAARKTEDVNDTPAVKDRVNVLEVNARAEAGEETCAEISTPVYIGNAVIDDWRYRNDQNEILTVFFAAKYMFGALTASDDMDGGELRWFALEDLAGDGISHVLDHHHVLVRLLLTKLPTLNI